MSKIIFFYQTSFKKIPNKILLLFQKKIISLFKWLYFLNQYICARVGDFLPRKAVINIYSRKVLKLVISIFGN